MIEQLLSLSRHRLFRGAVPKPILIVVRTHDRHPTFHLRVIRPTVFGAKNVIAARFGCFKPVSLVAAGHHVMFETKRRNIEAVEDVFAREREFYRPAGGHVQLIDLALAVGVLDFPHPLLSDHVDIERILSRRRVVLETEFGSPSEHHQHHQERDHAPYDFERERAVDRLGTVIWIFSTVFESKERNEEKNHNRHHDPYYKQERVKRVDFASRGGGAIGKDGEDAHSRSNLLVPHSRGMPRAKIAAEHNDHESPQQAQGQQAAEAQQVHDDQTVLTIGWVVMEAIKLHLVDRRSDALVGGLDQPKFYVTGGIVDAEEVATGAPFRSQQNDAAAVRVLVGHCIVDKAKADRGRESLASGLISRKKVPALFRAWPVVIFHVCLLLGAGHLRSLARIEAQGDDLIILARGQRETFQAANQSVENHVA